MKIALYLNQTFITELSDEQVEEIFTERIEEYFPEMRPTEPDDVIRIIPTDY